MSESENAVRKNYPRVKFTSEKLKAGAGKEVFRVTAFDPTGRAIAQADAGAEKRAWQEVGKKLRRRR